MLEQIEDALDSGDNVVIMKAGKRMAAIKKILKKRNLENNAAMAERCGLTGEKLFYRIENAGDTADYLSTVLVKGRRDDALTGEIGTGDVGVSETGAGAVDVSETGVSGVGVSETGAGDVGVSKAGTGETGVSGVGVSEAGTGEINAGDVAVPAKGPVYFVGAGSGAPDLITLRGMECLRKAGMIIFAGSLVNRELLSYAPPGCEILDSSKMTLDEVISSIKRGLLERKLVVRLHTGDSSIFGAVREQFEELGKLGIAYEVVPGVSSFLAAAAALKAEYTLPGVSQTVILTRMAGRTPAPESENIRSLAAHNASMAIFLSCSMLIELAAELSAGGYAPDTPVALVYKVSWPDEMIIRTDIGHMAEEAEKLGIERTALVLVGGFLGGAPYDKSRLYAPDFTHGYRTAKDD
jgi:precorrin-4/cobalt-precorrin-4 C11-methyltransferase